MRIDAHCHTDCSDGALTIEERIAMIKACGYDAATITDHDFISTAQVQRAIAACDGLPFVPGIEFSLRHEGKVVHLLGYFVNPENSELQNYLAEVQSVDKDLTGRLLVHFQGKGADFQIDDLLSSSLHTFYSLQLVKRIARDLFQNDPQNCMPAFLNAMKQLGFSYADLAPWEVSKAIDLIHSAGGIAVLAHPGGREDKAMVSLGFLVHEERHIAQYVDWGLDGLEVSTPVHTRDEKDFYQQSGAKYHLFASAGSDCHGDDPYLGPALMGKFTDIANDSYEQLLSCYNNKKY